MKEYYCKTGETWKKEDMNSSRIIHMLQQYMEGVYVLNTPHSPLWDRDEAYGPTLEFCREFGIDIEIITKMLDDPSRPFCGGEGTRRIEEALKGDKNVF